GDALSGGSHVRRAPAGGVSGPPERAAPPRWPWAAARIAVGKLFPAGVPTALAPIALDARLREAVLAARARTAVLRDDIEVISSLHDLVLAQLQTAIRHALAGLHVVLVAMPWTDEVQFVFAEVEPAR